MPIVGFGNRQGKENSVSLSTMYPHRIRLRGPWECEPIDGPPPQRVTMPGRWMDAGLAGFRGDARFTRKFGYPGRVDESEHVWLTCDGCTGCGEVHLNGQLLARDSDCVFAFDVTSILSARNRLEVLIHGDTDETGLWGEVVLEIRKDAYLADVHVTRTESTLHLAGRAVGLAPQALELYTLVDNRTKDYRTILPKPAGEPFNIDVPDLAPLSQSVRVELIHISAIWYAVELSIPHWHCE
jgi:hypothetical protein